MFWATAGAMTFVIFAAFMWLLVEHPKLVLHGCDHVPRVGRVCS